MSGIPITQCDAPNNERQVTVIALKGLPYADLI